MRAIPLFVLLLAGLCPSAAIASGSDDDVTLVAGTRVSTSRGVFDGEDGANASDVVVLRGSEVGGAIPDPSHARRERRSQLPPVRSDADTREPPVRIRIFVPSVVFPPARSYGLWLPYERSRHYRIAGHHARGKHFGKHKKHHGYRKHIGRYEKHEHRGVKLRVAARPFDRRSSILGASHSKRQHGVHRGKRGARRGPGLESGRKL